jgi:hypothetical protein
MLNQTLPTKSHTPLHIWSRDATLRISLALFINSESTLRDVLRLVFGELRSMDTPLSFTVANELGKSIRGLLAKSVGTYQQISDTSAGRDIVQITNNYYGSNNISDDKQVHSESKQLIEEVELTGRIQQTTDAERSNQKIKKAKGADLEQHRGQYNSTPVSSPMDTPPNNDGNSDNWQLSLVKFFTERPWGSLLFIAVLGGSLILLVVSGRIKIPGILEPTNQTTEKNEELIVTVNLVCTWKSPGKLTKPIESAAVTVISVRTGRSLNVLGKGIDSNGRISFDMGKADIASVTIRHPDIRDSQRVIPNIEITESDSTLKNQKNAVSRTDCYFDAK